MFTEPQYQKALQRLCVLMIDDPAVDTDEGRELNVLADQVLEYERAHFPDTFKRQCDFCLKDCLPEDIDCEEGDLWACFACQDAWAKEDGGVRKY